jgi:hypothetical protein
MTAGQNWRVARAKPTTATMGQVDEAADLGPRTQDAPARGNNSPDSQLDAAARRGTMQSATGKAPLYVPAFGGVCIAQR